MAQISILTTTAGSEAEALSLARTLVEEQLVACVQLIPHIRSVYRWKGEICDEAEQLLLMKTRTDLVPEVQNRIRQLHSYEVPEIVSFPLSTVLPEYLAWVLENTASRD